MLIISGMSGSGKSIALNTLEDLGYYCVDNLPVILLEAFIHRFALNSKQPVAVAIDSRNAENLASLPEKITELRHITPLQLIYLTADNQTLTKRFSESRRPHPLSYNLNESAQITVAIEKERQLLSEVNNLADITLDTSSYSATELSNKLSRILNINAPKLILTIQSFGFKNGTPINADFIFDVRFLPNPHWEPSIRQYSGTQQPIIDWFKQYEQTQQYIDTTATYLKQWLPHFINHQKRAYLTICIGCTGGQHRSVFVTEGIGAQLKSLFPDLYIEHRDMKPYQKMN